MNVAMNDLDRVRELARTALAALERSRRRIDDLNVYPVPDGDTGTNLTLTARAILEALESSDATERPEIARELTRAALMGARGNSGVIFSQILRGAAEALTADAQIDEGALARAFRAASDAAYRAVRKPVEGTMLTVIRELAEEGVTIELSVVVEYGLNLAEVASTVRNRVRYEVERLTGLPVASVEVRIEDVRRTA